MVFWSIQRLSDICMCEKVLTIFRLFLIVVGRIIRRCIVISALSPVPPMRPSGLVVETLLPAGVEASAGLGIVIHHCRLIEERCVELVWEEAFLLAVEKDVPYWHERNLEELQEDQAGKPYAFLFERSLLVDTVATRLRAPDQELQGCDQDKEAAEDPFHHRVDRLERLSVGGRVPVLLHISVIKLAHVELKEGWVEEVGRCRIETQLEAEFKSFGNVEAGGCLAVRMRRKGHNGVEGQEQSIQNEASDVIEALI